MRSLAASCTLLLASIFAHILAGGDILSLDSLALISFSSVFVALIVIDHSDDPIRVSFAIFAAQNLGHFISGGRAESELRMLLSHLAAAFLSYHLLRYFNRNLPSLGSIVLAHIARYIFVQFVPPTLSHAKTRNTCHHLNSLYLGFTHSLRAPPLH